MRLTATFPLLTSLVFSIPAILTPAYGQEDFEGTFTYKIELDENPGSRGNTSSSEVDFYVKDHETLIQNHREQNTAYNFKMLVRNDREEFYILLDQNERKVAMKQDLNAIHQMNQRSDGEGQEVRLRRTNETKEILGYSCTKYKINQASYKGQAWITDELSLEQEMEAVFNIMKQHPKSKEGVGAISASNYPEKGVVVASSLKAKDGDQTIHSEMKQIREKDIKAQRFDIGQYKVMNISGGQSFGD
jgi:hypothetical protein